MTGDRGPRLAVIPSAPLLIPGATGRTTVPETSDLSRAVRRAVCWLGEHQRPIMVVTAGIPHRWPAARVSARELGLSWEGSLGDAEPQGPVQPNYPTGLIVAAVYAGSRATGELITTTGASLSTDPTNEADGCSILVVGSGSARRRDGAPGYVDERAVPHDALTENALRSGDVAELCNLDLDRATALLDDVCAPLRAVASRLSAPTGTWLDYCADPYGVAYFVARWQM